MDRDLLGPICMTLLRKVNLVTQNVLRPFARACPSRLIRPSAGLVLMGLIRKPSVFSFVPHYFGFYFEAEGRVAALRAASRKSFGLSVQDINARRAFISFRANGPSDHLRYRKMVRRTILLLRAYKVSIHGHFICDTLLLFW